MTIPQRQLPISISSAGDTTIIPAEPNQYIKVERLVLSLAAETTVQFKSGSSSISGPQTMLDLMLDNSPADPWYVTGKGEAFVISLGSAVQTGGTVWYRFIT